MSKKLIALVALASLMPAYGMAADDDGFYNLFDDPAAEEETLTDEEAADETQHEAAVDEEKEEEKETTTVPISTVKRDTEAPSIVSNVVVKEGKQSALLTWDDAEDDNGVVRYRIYYGTRPVDRNNDFYDAEVDVMPDEEGTLPNSYRVVGLEPDVTYYFAVTAFDAMDNESEDYSAEVSTVPHEGRCEVDGELFLCDETNCSDAGGYWYLGACNLEPEVIEPLIVLEPGPVMPDQPVPSLPTEPLPTQMPETGPALLIPLALAGGAVAVRRWRK